MKADATDPTGSQSTERTSDPVESKHSTTQTTKLENIVERNMIAYGMGSVSLTANRNFVKAVAQECQSEAYRIALEAIGEDTDRETLVTHGSCNPACHAISENLTKADARERLKALTAPEGGKHD